MKRDLIFVFLGGTMSGVFSAGVAKSLKDHKLYNRIHSFYTTSAGAHSAAFFLSDNIKEGSTIYCEEMISDKFILHKKCKFLWTMFLRTFNKNVKIEKLMNIDYLIDVEKNKKKLNLSKISKAKINLFIRVFNIKTKKAEWLKGKTNILKKLKATSALLPFYPKTIKINKKEYSDGDTLLKTIDPFLEDIINNNPDKKVFLVFNETKRNRINLNAIIINFIWTIFLLIYFQDAFVLKKENYFCREQNVKKIYKNSERASY